MTNTVESSNDFFVEERQLEIEASRLDDPFVQLALAEENDIECIEEMSFDDFLNTL